MFRVCIIGCGMIAKNAHIPAYRSVPDRFEITALCDVSRDAAEKTALSFGIKKYYTNVREMLEKEKPDIVSVCAPNMLHKEYVMAAIENGANVLCEKPLALTAADAKEMFSFAKKHGKILMACQTLRFLPERLAVKDLIDKGELGEVYYAEHSRIRRRGIPTWGKFHLKEHSGGGALIDIGVHGLDSTMWLMGNPKPTAVVAAMRKVHADEIADAKKAGALKGGVDTSNFNPEDMNVESFSEGNVRFENGASLNFKIAWAANLREENTIILSGLKKGVDTEHKMIYSGVDKIEELKVTPNGFAGEPFYGHFCITDNLYNCLTGKAEPFVKPEETINVTAVIEAAYQSAETGREVIL